MLQNDTTLQHKHMNPTALDPSRESRSVGADMSCQHKPGVGDDLGSPGEYSKIIRAVHCIVVTACECSLGPSMCYNWRAFPTCGTPRGMGFRVIISSVKMLTRWLLGRHDLHIRFNVMPLLRDMLMAAWHACMRACVHA